ncbi:MAG: hypothetical protein AB7E49_11095, partial [Campylobacterales bacterium]
RTLSLLESEHIVTSISFGVSGKKYEYGMKQHHGDYRVVLLRTARSGPHLGPRARNRAADLFAPG